MIELFEEVGKVKEVLLRSSCKEVSSHWHHGCVATGGYHCTLVFVVAGEATNFAQRYVSDDSVAGLSQLHFYDVSKGERNVVGVEAGVIPQFVVAFAISYGSDAVVVPKLGQEGR